MVELFPKERLQPSLLDRLSDDEPYKKVESREKRVLSFQKLKLSVVRDLEWLLNAGCLENTQDLNAFPQIKQSVLNYGIPDFTGTTATNLDAGTLEFMLRQRILAFEPRLLQRSLKVRVKKKEAHNTIPNLVDACCTGKHLSKAKLTCKKASGKDPVEYLTIELKTCMVTSLHTGGADGSNGQLTETFTLNFEEFKLSYEPQDKSGKAQGSVDVGFNIAENKAI